MTFIQNRVSNPHVVNILVDNTGSQLRLGIQSIDGRIRTLVDEQIASFVELSVKGGSIDEGSAQEIRNSFKHVITGLRTNERPLLSNLREQYKALNSKIEKCVLKANETGKKVLILVGEDHRDRKCLLVQLMTLDIASRLGVKNLLTETTHDLLEKIKLMHLDDVMSPNFSFALKFALKLGFRTTPCDPEQFNANDEVRVVAMNQSIANSNTNSTLFVGVNHLIDISTDERIKTVYEILCINASNIGEEKKAHLFKSLLYPQNRLNFALNSENAMQLDIPGNPYSFEYREIEKLIKLVNQQEEKAPAVAEVSSQLRPATGITRVPSIETEARCEQDSVESLNQKLKEYPGNIANRLQRAKKLYFLGRKKEALNDYLYVFGEYPKNREAQDGIENCMRSIDLSSLIEK